MSDINRDAKARGDWIEKRCPVCGSQLLGNGFLEEWCSHIYCEYEVIAAMEESDG